MHVLVATIVLLFALGHSEPTSDNCEPCYQNFGPDCYYVLVKKYPGIREFEMFWVEGFRPNLGFSGAAYVNKTFHRFEGTLERNRISFRLALPDEINYRFDGIFLPGGRAVRKDRIAIAGRLTKSNQNKKVVAMKVKLNVGCGSNQ